MLNNYYETSINNVREYLKAVTDLDDLFAISEESCESSFPECYSFFWRKKNFGKEFSVCLKVLKNKKKMVTEVRLPITIKPEDVNIVYQYTMEHIAPIFRNEVDVFCMIDSITVSRSSATYNEFFDKDKIMVELETVYAFSNLCLDLLLEASHVKIEKVPDYIIRKRVIGIKKAFSMLEEKDPDELPYSDEQFEDLDAEDIEPEDEYEKFWPEDICEDEVLPFPSTDGPAVDNGFYNRFMNRQKDIDILFDDLMRELPDDWDILYDPKMATSIFSLLEQELFEYFKKWLENEQEDNRQ